MKLNSEYVVFLDRRRIRDGVRAGGRRDIAFRQVVTVREVEPGFAGKTFKEPRAKPWNHLVPAHVRNTQAGNIKLPHTSRKDAETPFFRRLGAPFKKSLHPEADTEKRNSAPDAVRQRGACIHRVQRPSELSEMTHPGEDDLRRFHEAVGRTNRHVVRADRIQCVGDRSKISRTVIENRDHSKPLVEGSWSFKRWSNEQAYRMARAKHLKMASSL